MSSSIPITTVPDQTQLQTVGILNVTYTVTATDVSNTYAVVSFNHNLNYAPNVIASFINSSDGIIRPMPFLYKASGQSYYLTSAPSGVSHIASATVQVDKINSSTITIRIDIHDIFGVSWVLTNYVFSFKFILQRQITITA